MPSVFVVSEDWSLRAAVRAELLETGIEAQGFASAGDAASAGPSGALPDALVMDLATASLNHTGLAPAIRRCGLVLIASAMEEAPPLPPGAVLLRKPVLVSEIVSAVRQILDGQPA